MLRSLDIRRLGNRRLGIRGLGIRRLGIRRLGIAIAVATILQAGAVRAEDTMVNIDNFTFEPVQLTVKAGTTVTWKNRDDIPHTIVSAGKFRSKTLDTDDSFSFTFTTAGDYKYFCSLHPHMTGMIKVE
ncbi:MAG: cupredoxin family copper-binding protein [Bradyrhizobium sp.]